MKDVQYLFLPTFAIYYQSLLSKKTRSLLARGLLATEMALCTLTSNQIPQSTNIDLEYFLTQYHWVPQLQQYHLYYFICNSLPWTFVSLPQTVASHLYKSKMNKTTETAYWRSLFIGLTTVLMLETLLASVSKISLVKSVWTYFPHGKVFGFFFFFFLKTHPTPTPAKVQGHRTSPRQKLNQDNKEIACSYNQAYRHQITRSRVYWLKIRSREKSLWDIGRLKAADGARTLKNSSSNSASTTK